MKLTKDDIARVIVERVKNDTGVIVDGEITSEAFNEIINKAFGVVDISKNARFVDIKCGICKKRNMYEKGREPLIVDKKVICEPCVRMLKLQHSVEMDSDVEFEDYVSAEMVMNELEESIAED